MANFMIRFLLCNVLISGIIGILLIAKWVFRNNLSSRMQYNLWLLLLGKSQSVSWEKYAYYSRHKEQATISINLVVC